MQNPNRDLWPDDIGNAPGLFAPINILREQASLLGGKTQYLVVAEVETDYTALSGLQHSFYLVAPALKHYRYLLFRVKQEATQFYPLEVEFLPLDKKFTANSEFDFPEILKEIFANEKTKEIIQILIAQSQN